MTVVFSAFPIVIVDPGHRIAWRVSALQTIAGFELANTAKLALSERR
jgi:hypothetical protein